MATTQDNRLLAIYTPLGKDYLLLQKVAVTESLSELFQIEVDLLHEEDEIGYQPTYIDPAAIIGKGVTVKIEQRDGTMREFSGIVNRFSQGSRNVRFSQYRATIVPYVWILTQKFQSRIYQNISVPDILRDIFQGFDVRYEIQGVTNRRNYCVQYRESDFAFASRLMEEEGIYYYFEHSNGKHTMIFANTPQSHRDCPEKNRIPYITDVTNAEEDFISSIHGWQVGSQLQTGKVTLWDHHFQLPTRKLDDQKTSIFNLGDNQKLELYDFPGGYARKYDEISSAGAMQVSELNLVNTDKQDAVKYAMEALDAQVIVCNGIGDCSAMTAGYRFELFNHPLSSQNARYVITSVTHEAEQNPSYISDENIEKPYANGFYCIAHGAGKPPFRPLRKTPKPIIQGGQTAFVVGPAGEEIYTDKYGRVKVQFNWDRHGQVDSSSSCWLRVTQTWAGNNWGAISIPRIGMEVVVNFLEGDPDQPIITGCVYNPQAMPPYTLPDEKTKSTIKSNSSNGGGGFNEFRFEDKKGSEQIFIHAQKDKDIRVKNDVKEMVLHDRHLIIENEQFEKVKKDKHLKVVGDHNEKVDGNISVHAGIDFEEKAGTKFAVDAGTEIHLKSGTSLTLETGTNLTLKVGGNFININSGGIFIKGTMVMLNSGGAAGTGSGSSPTAPTDPKEADTGQPGTTPRLQSRRPPPRPTFISPAASVLITAAQSGATFCEICSRS
ncbi:MAG: type VI secretion system tip protein VgrG [Pyrinomonadaceae bacterium]|nr:type VI secretion system tip protein VgrG [Pyrinomonadaceae bacterium]